jgi:hypothetical protein
MPIPPDDLPRSGSGRVPQWVIDEAAGRRAAPTQWREWEQTPTPAHEYLEPEGRRTRWLSVMVTVMAVAISVGSWAQTGWPGVPDEWLTQIRSAVGHDEPPLMPDVLALADASYMTDHGPRDLLRHAAANRRA